MEEICKNCVFHRRVGESLVKLTEIHVCVFPVVDKWGIDCPVLNVDPDLDVCECFSPKKE